MDASKTVRPAESWKAGEILNQVRATRKQEGVNGQVYWNTSALMRNNTLDWALERETYQQPALVPALLWLDSSSPDTPRMMAKQQNNRFELAWEPASDGKTGFYVLQSKRGKEWQTEVLAGTRQCCAFQRPWPEVVALTAISRFGNASSPAVLELKAE
jgi:hypothetical protein